MRAAKVTVFDATNNIAHVTLTADPRVPPKTVNRAMWDNDYSRLCVPMRSALRDAGRGALVYAGRLIVFRNVAAMHELIAHAERNVRDFFGSRDPTTAQFSLSPHSYQERAARLQTQFEKDPDTAQLLACVLEQTGVHAAQTFADRTKLRIQPHGDRYVGGRSRPTGIHRDTWGSNIYQQVNWWAPLYPVTRETTLAFYPRYWREPVPNSSAQWDFDALLEHRRTAPAGERDAYPSIPRPLVEVDVSGELRPVLDPGDVLCFSGAQLHGTVPNWSGGARFNVEIRTVYLQDLERKRSAPNVDGEGKHPMYRWFKALANGTPLETVAPCNP